MNNRNYNQFEKDLACFCFGKHRHENIVFSPVSIWIMLELLSEMSSGATKEEITKLIGSTYMNITENKDECLLFASVVFKNARKTADANERFIKEILEEKYNGRYICSENYARDVSDWIKKATKGMIPETEVGRDAVFGIVNAICFDAMWNKKYSDSDIETGIFVNCDGSKKEVDYLKSSEFIYLENECVRGFAKPYQNRKYPYNTDYSFVGLLPKNENENVLEALSSVDIKNVYKNHMEKKRIIVKIPEFKAESSLDVKEFLIQKGICNLFTDNAVFSLFSDTLLKIDKINQKTVIEVDRKGTKAAAAVIVEEIYGSRMYLEPETVYLDRPFIYAIVHNQSGYPVFTGVVNRL